MSEYTPTTEDVRAACSRYMSSEDFDRWLAAHDAEVLREAATALGESTRGLNRSNPLELAYINCTHIDAQELRHRADRIERGER